jgi:hypothetical protein
MITVQRYQRRLAPSRRHHAAPVHLAFYRAWVRYLSLAGTYEPIVSELMLSAPPVRAQSRSVALQVDIDLFTTHPAAHVNGDMTRTGIARAGPAQPLNYGKHKTSFLHLTRDTGADSIASHF